jgi:general secretion pathway protein A
MKEIRDAGQTFGRRGPTGGSPDLLVSSRRTALETLRKAVSLQPAGPILLTGEPGTGKTWLCQRLIHELGGQWRSVSVEMSPALDSLDFLRLIVAGLGIESVDGISGARLAMVRVLEDDLRDGRSWMLVIENTQSGPQVVWNEIDALVHSMEASRGFGAMILAGTSELARGVASRSRTALATRIATHVHLLPLDLDEACELVESRENLGPEDRSLLNELHRETLGNPRRLLQVIRRTHRHLAGSAVANAISSLARAPEPKADQDLIDPVRTFGTALAVGSPLELATPTLLMRSESAPGDGSASQPVDLPLVPGRPPLRVEEGLIEVGWEGSLESESVSANELEPVQTSMESSLDEESLPSEQIVEDHYAALQAWTEWARNRSAGASPDSETDHSSGEVVISPVTSVVAPPIAEISRPATLRAEPQHEHAPYSQLFSKLRQTR